MKEVYKEEFKVMRYEKEGGKISYTEKTEDKVVKSEVRIYNSIEFNNALIDLNNKSNLNNKNRILPDNSFDTKD